MAKIEKKFEETREHLRSELERTDAEVRRMERDLKVKQKHLCSLRKAFKVLGGAIDSAPSDSITLEDVEKAILAVFGSQDQMPEQALRAGVLESLKADPSINHHGLGLRVSQAMKRLNRTEDGQVLRPSSE